MAALSQTFFENEERTVYGMQTCTFPTWPTILWMPPKFTTIAPSSGILVNSDTVCAASFAPPYENAALILFFPPGHSPPAGTLT